MEIARLLESKEIPAVKDRRVDLWVEIPQPAQLAVLSCDELLAKDGQLDEQIMLGKKEVRTEGGSRVSGRIPLQNELNGLVEPRDA